MKLGIGLIGGMGRGAFVGQLFNETGQAEVRIVYDINGKSLNRMPVLLLYPRELEVTEAIAKDVNEGHEGELKKAQDELKTLEASLAADVDSK